MKSLPRTLALSDMLRSGACVLLFVASFIGFVTAEYNVYNNGWIPVSPDKVYNQIRREFAHTRNHYRSEHNDVFKVFNNTSSSLVHRQSEISKRKDVVENGKLNWTEVDEQNNLGPVTFQQYTSGIDSHAIHINKTIRKAKKISEYVVNKEVNDIIDRVEEYPKGEIQMNKIITKPSSDDIKSGHLTKLNKYIIADDSTNIYEVTEVPKEDYIINQNNLTKHYYNSPASQNLTTKFFDILSKYNIKANDKLENYELSRLNKDEIPMKQNYRVPGLIPYGQNSANHIPIDPLFAVFLSNYGVYLPGMYGINSNYSNLYGYLASNNIHNNKPFGLYKVYSDTDSSS